MNAHHHRTGTTRSFTCETARARLDRLVLAEASRLVLATVEGVKQVAAACPPDLRRHLNGLAEELAGVTVDSLKQWPA